MAAVLGEFAENHPEVTAAQVDVRSSQALALREKFLWPEGVSFSVSLIPTTIIFAQGKPQLTLYGAAPNQLLEEKLARWLQRAAPGLGGPFVLTEREKRALEALWSPPASPAALGPGVID